MAKCMNPSCNKEVGCGCNLKNGLCPTCAIAKQNKEAEEAKNKVLTPIINPNVTK